MKNVLDQAMPPPTRRPQRRRLLIISPLDCLRCLSLCGPFIAQLLRWWLAWPGGDGWLVSVPPVMMTFICPGGEIDWFSATFPVWHISTPFLRATQTTMVVHYYPTPRCVVVVGYRVLSIHSISLYKNAHNTSSSSVLVDKWRSKNG